MILRFLGSALLAFGFDPRKLYRSLLGFPSYMNNFLKLCKLVYRGRVADFKIRLLPVLSDIVANSGVAKGHYFHQDLWAARRIYDLKPSQHIDIGSRIDGFVGHLLTFMNVTIIDVRPLISKVPGLNFMQRDMMDANSAKELFSDSVSCLHALEHFGLGRYGDSFDLDGWSKGLANLASIVSLRGRLYLSVPIGPQVIEFNAQRIFMPQTIIDAAEKLGLTLYEFSYINDVGDFHQSVSLNDIDSCQFGCGCFEFIKTRNPG